MLQRQRLKIINCRVNVSRINLVTDKARRNHSLVNRLNCFKVPRSLNFFDKLFIQLGKFAVNKRSAALPTNQFLNTALFAVYCLFKAFNCHRYNKSICSTPTNLRPILSATAAVVPQPRKLSKTMSPLFVASVNIR